MSTRSIETGNLGFPRIGLHRELKFALERFWGGEWNAGQLETAGRRVRGERWQMQMAVAAARRVREATRAAPTAAKR
jgi:cobalamin-independent synthase